MLAHERFGPLLARTLLGAIFVWAGYGKIIGFAGTVGYIGSKGLPLPEILAVAAIVLELGSGLLLITGIYARWAALSLAFVCLFTAVLFHDFWSVPSEQVRGQMIHFLKNLAILGGMMMVALHGSGPLSVRKADA